MHLTLVNMTSQLQIEMNDKMEELEAKYANWQKISSNIG